jgi:hypothetical protein
MQRGGVAPQVGIVLDVVHDQRAGVEALDHQGQLRGMGAGHTAGQAIAQLHEPRTKALAGTPQEVAERPQQRLLPEGVGHLARGRGVGIVAVDERAGDELQERSRGQSPSRPS